MKSNKSKIISISLPPDMTEEVQDIAKEERRSVSEVIREALRQYGANRDLETVRKYARKVVKKKGIKPDDVVRIVREGRR
jgi:CopG family transcriptional regulator/antitoxin EndoAI